jgi:hypothetical protein
MVESRVSRASKNWTRVPQSRFNTSEELAGSVHVIESEQSDGCHVADADKFPTTGT